MRRGIAINTLGRIVLGLALILFIAIFLWSFRDRIQDAVTWIQDVVRFGL
jgi:hypothetical protein